MAFSSAISRTTMAIGILFLLSLSLALSSEVIRMMCMKVDTNTGEATYCKICGSIPPLAMSSWAALLAAQLTICWATRGTLARLREARLPLSLFIISWVSFLVAVSCLLVGGIKNTRAALVASHNCCPKLVFAAGAVFALVDGVAAAAYYYLSF
ncbi:hypothetical protein RND81_07G142200 [Saponaria officinalis]|uniref:CASP-like protein n=1 Tax=Saponaria officinalis TaxID=3572 RepID=A0AAW1JRA8_SAPOF